MEVSYNLPSRAIDDEAIQECRKGIKAYREALIAASGMIKGATFWQRFLIVLSISIYKQEVTKKSITYKFPLFERLCKSKILKKPALLARLSMKLLTDKISQSISGIDGATSQFAKEGNTKELSLRFGEGKSTENKSTQKGGMEFWNSVKYIHDSKK